MTKLEQYYNKFHEEHRLTTRHGRVEFNTSMNFILKYARKTGNEPSKIKIADIGAGTGRYSVELCHNGYDVTAVELVKHNLEILRSKHENIKTWQGDARNLNFLEDNTFDVTLLFGPLYHLHGDDNKCAALKEAKRITKPEGIILAAYVMNDYSVISYFFKEHKWTPQVLNKGLTEDYHTVCTEDDLYDYVRMEDVNRINESCKLERITVFAPDGPADYMRKELNEMTEIEFEAFLNYQLAVCERPELLGASSHIVDVLKNIKD